MVSEDQIFHVHLTKQQLDICKSHAGMADIRGKSNVDAKRTKQLEYQLCGQVCEAALFIWSGLLFHEYDQRRQRLNKNPFKGDGGYDLEHEGYAVDVKGSFMRSPHMTPFQYHLFVRDVERKSDRYVLGLAYPDSPSKVMLVGWWPDGYLTQKTVRHDIPAILLYPMQLF